MTSLVTSSLPDLLVPEFKGRVAPIGRVAILVSRYHERITSQLLRGAQECCEEAGIPDSHRDVYWVAGAWELGVVAEALGRNGGHACIVALGAVIRGETPHFDFVAREAAHALAEVARCHRVPVGFGLLTTDTLSQAADRAGGAAGNKGREAAEAALSTAHLLQMVDANRAPS